LNYNLSARLAKERKHRVAPKPKDNSASMRAAKTARARMDIMAFAGASRFKGDPRSL